MATRTIIYWRDIPAQVIVKHGRKTEKRELPKIFITTIDQAAMNAGLADSGDYLEQWRRGDSEPCDDDIVAAADNAVEQIVAHYDKARLVALAKAGGSEANADA